MSIFLYIMGMIPTLIVVHHTPQSKKLFWQSRIAIVLFWPAAMFLTAVIFLWQLWVVKDGA